MKILSYKVESSKEDKFYFPELIFKKLNLIVGNSGTGKTRLLNTIFNISTMAVRKNQFYLGSWSIVFEHDSVRYKWVIETDQDDDKNRWIKKEEITYYENDGEIKTIVSRNTKKFIFNGKDMPKLSKTETTAMISFGIMAKMVHGYKNPQETVSVL